MDFASHVVSVARAEATRMRTAVAGADPAAKVNLPVQQFSKLADLIALLCDLVPEPGNGAVDDAASADRVKETTMDENKALENARTLAQIESDMLTAEAAYVDAETRLKQAERDRDTALDAVNKHQSEIDAAIARMRQRSPAGSKWRSEAGRSKEVLMLGREEAAEAEATLIQPDFGSATDERR